MDVLERITKLREERNWTEYELAKKSGLAQSTISTWYRRGMYPTIPSLEQICGAFGITLSMFFLEDSVIPQKSSAEKDTGQQPSRITITITSDQFLLLHNASKLDQDQFQALLKLLETI